MRNICFVIFCFPLILSAQNQIEKAIANFDSQNYSKAEVQFKAIINQNPNNFKAYEYLGDTYAAKQEWDKAIKVFEYLLEKQPKNADYNYKYGGSIGMKAKSSNKLTALFLLDDVKKYLKQAANLDVKHIDVRWALLELYLELPGVIGGSIDTAKNYAEQLQNISPVDGALAYGRIADYQDDFNSAEKHFKQAVEIGGSKTCYSKLIDLYVKYQKPDNALHMAKEAIQKLNAKDFNFKYTEIALNFNTKIDNAVKYIDAFIQNHNSSQHSLDEALILKAKLHHKLGQVDEAKFCLTQALAHNPDSIQAKTELKRIQQL
ncbi:tetratricopeptide repeat protein [Mesohalobacter salilacus]|uniref:tetratricopeptide repeat protein n=1 Tax=Mesohalobacter salilacus TaxID=2491711 RepID=UPI00403EB3A5